MIRAYKYFFYRNYSFLRKLNKKSNSGIIAFKSISLITFLLTVDFDFILRIVEANSEVSFGRIIFLIVFGSIYIVNTLFFFNGNRYEVIIDEFKTETKEERVFSVVLTILFITLSVVPIIMQFFR